MAQRDTIKLTALLCLVLAACSPTTEVPADAAVCQPLPCPENAHWNAERCACVSAECQTHTDCSLVFKGCCGGCLPPGADDVVAVPKAKVEETSKEYCPNTVSCGECYVEDPEPLAPLMAAACVEQRCQAVNLRADALTACERDEDCAAVSRGCCPAYSDNPAEYVGVDRNATPDLLMCFPIPPCIPPDPHADPIAFCAEDKHCAVRRRDTLHGKESSSCYSPTQNLEQAYDADAVGCDCPPMSLALCRSDRDGRRVALICEDTWTAVEDGPCAR